MLANAPAPARLPHVRGRRHQQKGIDILGLPIDVFLLLVKDHLTIFDRAALALVCKAFAEKILFFPSLLKHHPFQDGERHHQEMTTFLRKTMKSWFPDHLKLCTTCGKYLPKDRGYWVETLTKECTGRAGKLTANFFKWAAIPDASYNSMVRYHQRWSGRPQCRICPRCKLHAKPC